MTAIERLAVRSFQNHGAVFQARLDLCRPESAFVVARRCFLLRSGKLNNCNHCRTDIATNRIELDEQECSSCKRLDSASVDDLTLN
ncbi:MAG: hypothetical protein JWM11_5483 [Planctomycetaceae bacterium]|nr:hypothetical protein [Planctomycetaceae bacterium]